MFRIVYISGATRHLGRRDLQDLLQQARQRNARLEITGLLLHKHGNFLQVLEGEKADVQAVFDSICQDPRHRRVIPVIQEAIDSRDFSDWSMAFQDIDLNAAVPPGFSDFLHASWVDLDLVVYSDTIRRYLRAFMVSTS